MLCFCTKHDVLDISGNREVSLKRKTQLQSSLEFGLEWECELALEFGKSIEVQKVGI